MSHKIKKIAIIGTGAMGKRIAIKAAINKYSSYKTGKDVESINGFKNQMRQFNVKLGNELLNLRRT